MTNLLHLLFPKNQTAATLEKFWNECHVEDIKTDYEQRIASLITEYEAKTGIKVESVTTKGRKDFHIGDNPEIFHSVLNVSINPKP